MLKENMNAIKRQWVYLKPFLVFSSEDRILFNRYSLNTNKKNPNLPIITVQCIEDYYYFILCGTLLKQLAQKTVFRVEHIEISEFKINESTSLKNWTYARLTRNGLFDRKWRALFKAFSNRIAYRLAGFIDSAVHMPELFQALFLWKQLKSTEDLLAMSHKNILVGDLIYDTYLRFKPHPTVSIQDPYLAIIIWRALRYARKSQHYFKTRRPKLFFTSYTTYIQHGIAARTACKLDIPVYSFGNIYEVYKKISLKDPYHTKNTETYAAEFAALENPETKRAEAQKALQERLSGGTDFSTFYMKKSAYVSDAQTPENLENIWVIFLHDFFDSPHIYGWLLFPDFWTWICKTIEILDSHQLAYIIKPHPNQSEEASIAMAELKKRYPNSRFMPSTITNVQLADAGIRGAVTVYGTVAHEMAYLGIPTIGCGTNPHQSFSFCQLAHSLIEYENLLLTISSTTADKESLKIQALSFYYMHNIHDPLRTQDIRYSLLSLQKALNLASFQFSQELENKLEEIERLTQTLNITKEFEKYLSPI